MKTDAMRSLLARYLPGPHARAYTSRWRRGICGWLRRYYDAGRLPVKVRLHGRPLLLRAASPYPFILAEAPHFNTGLVAAAECLFRHAARPLRIIDVGAAGGDTVALLAHHLPGGIGRCLSIDGDPANRAFFEANTAGIEGVAFFETMLAAQPGEMASLVRHHPDSAHAAGAGRVPCRTLDALLAAEDPDGRWDLLKTDVDGYDGDVLMGATETLGRSRPLVIFEWHPWLVRACDRDPHAPFRALAKAGYGTMLWFRNRGPFSHRTALPSGAEVNWWVDYLIARHASGDPHFDIVALPPALESLADAIARAAVYPG